MDREGARKPIDSAKIRQDFERFIREYPARAKVQHYVQEAKKRQPVEASPRLQDQIRLLLTEAKIAEKAIEAQDLDLFAQAFERIIRHSIDLQLPKFADAVKAKLRSDTGKGKLGFRGSLYRMLECFFWDLDLSEPDQIFRLWIKAAASKTIERKDGRKWRYKSVQIHYPEGEDSEHPRNFEYLYAENGNWKKATIANIKITFERVCDEANLD